MWPLHPLRARFCAVCRSVALVAIGGSSLLVPRHGEGQARCVITAHALEESAARWGRRDSARFAIPRESRDGVACHPRQAPEDRAPGRTGALHLQWPSVQLVAAEGIPESRSDGALWAGRGLSTLVRMGAAFQAGPLHLALAPELWGSANRPYDLLRSTALMDDSTRWAPRSPLASPFYYGPHTLDLPSRLGVLPLRVVAPGQSAAWLSGRGVDAGVSTSNSWWGPGVRDGLLLGPGASGIPRVFLRTTRPLRTRTGSWRGEWFVGTLTESRWFDQETANDRRSIGALRIEWSPNGTPGLILGAARAVQSVQQGALPFSHFTDVWRSTTAIGADQMAALFASLTTPGMRTYAEVVTARPPSALEAFLAGPADDLGYQLGVERRLVRAGTVWLLHAEVMNTDPGISRRDRPARDFYAGASVPHGWTQRGQLLGAGIGPGGSSQWLAVDRMGKRISVGAYAERVRWNNEVLPRLYLPTIFRHDVTVRGGVRASVRQSRVGVPYLLSLDASWGTRLNYLFQNTTWIRDFRTVDVRVPQLRLTVTPVR